MPDQGAGEQWPFLVATSESVIFGGVMTHTQPSIRTSTAASSTQVRTGSRAAVHDPEELYRAGVKLTRREDYRKALTLFEQALRLRPSEPRFQSYVGLCLAVTGKKVRAAVELCERAARAEFFRADHYCNLGAVYEVAGDRRKAYDAYLHGLQLDRSHGRIRVALRKMGRRRPPVFPFLPRTSSVNRMAGIVLCRLGLR